MLINQCSIIVCGEHSHHITKNNGRKSVVTTRYILYVLTNPSPWRLLIRTWIIVNKHKSYETTCQCRRRNGFTEVWFQISMCHILVFHLKEHVSSIYYVFTSKRHGQESNGEFWRLNIILIQKYVSEVFYCDIASRRMPSYHTVEKPTLCQLIRERVNTWASVHPGLRRHVAPLGANEKKKMFHESRISFHNGIRAANMWYLWTASLHEGKSNKMKIKALKYHKHQHRCWRKCNMCVTKVNMHM